MHSPPGMLRQAEERDCRLRVPPTIPSGGGRRAASGQRGGSWQRQVQGQEGVCGCDVDGVVNGVVDDVVNVFEDEGRRCVWMWCWWCGRWQRQVQGQEHVCGCDVDGVVNGVVDDVVSVFEDESEAVNPFCPSSAFSQRSSPYSLTAENSCWQWGAFNGSSYNNSKPINKTTKINIAVCLAVLVV